MSFRHKPAQRRRGGAGARGRNLTWGDRLAGIDLARAARARSSASAASTARASASCCWRCSACCAASMRQHQDRRQAGRGSAARAQAKRRAVGMALIPEDRKTEGLMLPMSVRDNSPSPPSTGFARGGIIDRGPRRAAVDDGAPAACDPGPRRRRPGRRRCRAATSRRS